MEENTKKNVYMCILGHFAVQQKLTEHCKSTIPQLKTIKKKKRFPQKTTALENCKLSAVKSSNFSTSALNPGFYVKSPNY